MNLAARHSSSSRFRTPRHTIVNVRSRTRMRWQHWAKGVLALGALAGAVAVGLTIKPPETPPPSPPVVPTDPKAVVERTGGPAVRFNRAHEEIRVEYEGQLTPHH